MATVLIRPSVFRFGAEELDASILEENLKNIGLDLYVFELSKDSFGICVRRWKGGKQILEDDVPLTGNLNIRSQIVHLLIGDPANRYYLKLGFGSEIERYLRSRNIEVVNIISSNSSLLGVSLSIKCKNRISRSVNFEPKHYFQENGISIKTPFVYLLKIWASLIERTFSHVLSISPNDMEDYLHFPSIKKIELFPLQQLQNLVPLDTSQKDSILNVGFLGSTFNVKHNRAGLDFIVDEVADLLRISKVQLNIYGVKAPNRTYAPNVRIHGWVEPISSIYELNDIFVVPYLGGTGQQSKFFEPLCMGKLLIADPNVTAGYPLVPNLHFLEAKTASEFAEVIANISRKVIPTNQILESALEFCQYHFSKSKNISTLKRFLV